VPSDEDEDEAEDAPAADAVVLPFEVEAADAAGGWLGG